MSFKKLLLTTSAAALLAGSALADGGPAPEPPPPPPPPEEEPYTPPPPAPEPAPSMWYAALHGGAVWLGDIEVDAGEVLLATDTDTGWAAGGALGYRYGTGFRAEVEGTYRDNDGLIFDVFEPTESAPLEVSSFAIMLNALYDFDMGGGFSPYLGAGIGTAGVDVSFVDVTGTFEDDGWAFAYQFIGGFSVPMPNSSLELFADYRYLATAGLELDFGGLVFDHDEYESHTVLGGLRFNF